MTDHTTNSIHEMGHALAAWWSGTPINLLAVGDGIHPDDDFGENVLGVHFVDGHLNLRTTFSAGKRVELTNPRVPDNAAGEALMRAMLEALAGPAAQWLATNTDDAGDAPLDELLVHGDISSGCGGDLEKVETLLTLLPEEQRPTAFGLSCWRAETLVARYWPEILAMADELLARGRLEQYQINVMMERHLGRPPWAGARRLGELDPPRTMLGDAEVVPRWSRTAPLRWNLRLFVGGYLLGMPRSLIYLTAKEGAEEGLPVDWYALVDHDHLTREPSPAGGILQAFAAEVMATKLAELRRGPAPSTNA